MVDHGSGLQFECCAQVIGAERAVGAQADEGDEVLPDQHPSQSDRAVSAVVVATQCRTPCLWVVTIDTSKDCRIAAGPLGLECLIAESRFHQDDREIDFLTIPPPEGRGRSGDRLSRPVSHLHKKSALSSW